MDAKWFTALTASHIAEELYAVDGRTASEQVRSELDSNSFDLAGVKDERGKVCGYVNRSKLSSEQHCQAAIIPFSVEELTPVDTPLQRLLRELAVEREHIFVIGHNGVEAILTRADLKKQPVKAMLFSMICELEEVMSQSIRACNVKLPQCLSEGRLEKARQLQSERKKKNQDLDLIECLELCDKFRVLSKEGWLDGLCESRQQIEKCTDSIQFLRNNLAHAHDPDSGMSWEAVVGIVETILEISGSLAERLLVRECG